jgi:glycosyltransferase involved in cell wall biosynthesis
MTSVFQPLVSLVTPVYNEEQYLAECIESVLAQTYQNWEYTVVDNCSTDTTAAIAEVYAGKDPRIRVHRNTTFLPQMPNFNHALRQISADSKYCKMVLGDDWLFPECLQRMVDTAERYPSAGLVSSYALEGGRVTLTGLSYHSTLVDGREACRRHLLERLHIFGTQTSVLYRADLVRARERFFDESTVHSDTEVCFELLKNTDFAFVHQVLTYTRVRPSSVYAQALELDTSWQAHLRLLMNYGPTYLTTEELSTEVADHVAGYYRFLGKNLLRGRDKTFWDFHHRTLLAAGIGFRRTRIVLGLFAALAHGMGRVWRASASPRRHSQARRGRSLSMQRERP